MDLAIITQYKNKMSNLNKKTRPNYLRNLPNLPTYIIPKSNNVYGQRVWTRMLPSILNGFPSEVLAKLENASCKQIRTATQLQRGPCLKLIFSFMETEHSYHNIKESDDFNFNISNLVEVRFKFNFQTEPNIIHFVSFKRHDLAPKTLNHNIQINVACEQLQYSKQFICPDKWTVWKKIGVSSKTDTETSTVEPLKITLIASKSKNIKFEALYGETDFCDFHLKTVDSDASVPVHKACLSLHSDVFKRMLHGEWKENKNDFIEIEGTTFQTLENLKKYMYLGILPNDGLLLRSLLLLAKCYMINDLMAECIRQLALNVKPEDLYSLQEFAIDNKIPELIQAVIQITSDKTVQMAHEIENNKTGEKTQAEMN